MVILCLSQQEINYSLFSVLSIFKEMAMVLFNYSPFSFDGSCHRICSFTKPFCFLEFVRIVILQLGHCLSSTRTLLKVMRISRIESIAVSVCDCLQRKLSWEVSVRPICSRLNTLSQNIVCHSTSLAFLLIAGERNEPLSVCDCSCYLLVSYICSYQQGKPL